MSAPTLETERLTLRAMALADFEPYAAAWADPRLTRFIGGEPRDRMTSWGKFLQGIGLWSLFGYGYWSFIERETSAFIGNGGLARFERGIEGLVSVPEAGWALLPDAWGKGYATEAIQAILAWADAQGLGEIRAIIDHDNHASNAVARKCGFEVLVPVIPGVAESALWRRAGAHSASAMITLC